MFLCRQNVVVGTLELQMLVIEPSMGKLNVDEAFEGTYSSLEDATSEAKFGDADVEAADVGSCRY